MIRNREDSDKTEDELVSWWNASNRFDKARIKKSDAVSPLFVALEGVGFALLWFVGY